MEKHKIQRKLVAAPLIVLIGTLLFWAGTPRAATAAPVPGRFPALPAAPSAPADGRSMIVSREGGHNQPAPKGVEYYLPYQTSVVKSAGAGPTMIVATRKTVTANNMDLARFWRNRNRRRGSQPQALHGPH